MFVLSRAASDRRLFPARLIALSAAALVVFAILCSGWGWGAVARAAVYDADEIEFVRLLNQYRAQKGLSALYMSGTAAAAATRHNLDMAKYDFFNHASVRSDYFPAGYQFYQRLAAMGYSAVDMGENIAAGFATAQQALDAWKASPGHDENMLTPEYRAIGVSRDYVANTRYSYYWTTDFGSTIDASARTVDQVGVRNIITGADRYQTAIMVTQRAYPKGAPAAVVVKGDNFPDALTAAPLAAELGGPVVITPSTGLTPALSAELVRLDPGTVYVVGLSTAVGESVKDLLGSGVDVRQLTGGDRYETSVMVAEELFALRGPSSQVALVPGDKFPDALSVAPLAARKRWPILITPQSGTLPSVVAQAFADLGVTSALVVGTWVEPPLPPSAVEYKVGSDRYETNAMISVYAADHGLTFGHLALATGENYPDALVVGPYLAQDGGILLLTRPTALPSTTAARLAANKDSVKTFDCVGLAGTVLAQAKMALQ